MKRILLLVSLVTVLGCERRSDKPNVELIQDMMVSPAIQAQDEDPNSMKLPPEGTIPQGWEPYKMVSAEEAAQKLKNPFEKNLENTLKGQKLYMTYCFSCHGAKGDGRGPIAEKWPAPIPTMLSENTRNWKDGHLYHLITAGRGLMGSYASQIRPDDRWKIITYIRHMQENSPVVNDSASAN